MTTLTSVFVSAAILQGIWSQTIPPECTSPPNELSLAVVDYPHLCCTIPHMFKAEYYTACKKTPGKDDFPKPAMSNRVRHYNMAHRSRLRNPRSILSERISHDTLCIDEECQRDLQSKGLTEEINFELFGKDATNDSNKTIRNYMKNIAARLRWQSSGLHPIGRHIQVNTRVGDKKKERKLKEKEKHLYSSQNCSENICLLRQQGVVVNEILNKDSYANYLDSFAAEHPTLNDSIALIKKECLKERRSRDSRCEPIGPYMCTRDLIIMNCPEWKRTEECQKLEEQVNHCKEHWMSLLRLL